MLFFPPQADYNTKTLSQLTTVFFIFYYYIYYTDITFSFTPKQYLLVPSSPPGALEILVDSFLLQCLYLHLYRTLVEMREQLLCVADKEVILVRLELLQHQRTDDQHVTPALDDQLISETSVKRTKDETPDKHVLYRSVCGTSFALEVTYEKTKVSKVTAYTSFPQADTVPCSKY